MPEKRIVPTISTIEDFESKNPGYLKPDKKLSIFLDYDGTLAKIASDPKNTAMTSETREILASIARNPNVLVTVISGRGLKDVQQRVGIQGITYGGNHGLEIEYPDGTRHDFELSMEVQENYKNLVKELNAKVYKNGAWVEDKRVSLTYHYGDVPLDISDAQKEETIRIVKKYGFRPNQAVDAIEAKPPVNWNKGEATLFIMRGRFGNDWASQTNVMFIGDDTTDEDAMKALQGMSSSRTFRISLDPEIQTFADFRLSSQSLVYSCLQWINNVYNA